MTEWLLAAGVWGLLLTEWFRLYRGTPAPPSPPVEEEEAGPKARARTRLITGDPAWSPEGWGQPDSEVISTAGDDYLARMHRPPKEDE